MQQESHSRVDGKEGGGPGSAGPAWLGVDLGGTTIRGGIVGPTGVLLHREVVQTKLVAGTAAAIAAFAGLNTVGAGHVGDQRNTHAEHIFQEGGGVRLRTHLRAPSEVG